MDNIQRIQDNQYTFPYHHIPRAENGKFSQIRELRFGYEYIAYTTEILKIIKNYKVKHLLDVGCGDGKFLFEAKKFFNPQILEGVDYSENAIAFARAFSPEIKFHIGNITKDDILHKIYNIITLIETLEHIPPVEIPEFLKTLQKYLKKDGVLILTVPSDNIAVQSKHYQHFNQKKIQNLLAPYFSIQKIKFLNKTGALNKIIKTILSNRIFVLNQYTTINFIYRFYCKHLLYAKEKNCGRLMVICKPR